MHGPGNYVFWVDESYLEKYGALSFPNVMSSFLMIASSRSLDQSLLDIATQLALNAFHIVDIFDMFFCVKNNKFPQIAASTGIDLPGELNELLTQSQVAKNRGLVARIELLRMQPRDRLPRFRTLVTSCRFRTAMHEVTNVEVEVFLVADNKPPESLQATPSSPLNL